MERRIVFTSPGHAAVDVFEVPAEPLGAWQVDVKTRVSLLSPGTELAFLDGRLGMTNAAPRTFPRTSVGYANIGTVLAAGDQTSVHRGQRVFSMGNHASRVRIDVRKELCIPVPDRVDDESAAFARIAQVSMTTMRTTFARAGDCVAVVGLGLVGNVAAQVFRQSGMTVDAFDPVDSRRRVARDAGVHSVHDLDEIDEFQHRHRLVIEASGSAQGLVEAVKLATNGGEVVMVGAPWGGDANSVPSSRLTRDIFFRFLRLRSGSEWEIPRQSTDAFPHSIEANLRTAMAWLETGKLVGLPLVTHRLSPAEIQFAYDGLRSHAEAFLGVVLNWKE